MLIGSEGSDLSGMLWELDNLRSISAAAAQRVKLLEDQIRADEKEIARLKAELEIAWSDENDPLLQENRELQASLDKSKKLLRLWHKQASEDGGAYSALCHVTIEFLGKE